MNMGEVTCFLNGVILDGSIYTDDLGENADE
jgi:hypothetical protein